MQKILLSLLALFSRAIIKKHKPYVIGVTGTIGKTTITTYIAEYLRAVYGEWNVGISPYHYNGEYGLPLTIIGAKTGGRNPLLWILVFMKAIWTYTRPYPRYLILEYGIDHPWEMEYLVSIVRPDIAILSPVAPNHLEQFGTFERYRDAKLLLIDSAKAHSIAHESLREFVLKENTYFYGKDASSDASIVSAEQNLEGINAEIVYNTKNYTITLPSFWLYQIENILPLYIISSLLQIDENQIEEHTDIFVPEAGRSRILRGKYDSVIIDGSYNGGFEAICRGIDWLMPFTSTHRIICLLWDMRELGDHTEELHARLAKYIVELLSGNKSTISLYLVWPLMEQYIYPLVKEDIATSHGLSSRSLGKEIAILLEKEQKPTIIYVKWSQNTIFLEEWVKEFLRNPEDAKLLCRQPREWVKTKEKFFSIEELSTL